MSSVWERQAERRLLSVRDSPAFVPCVYRQPDVRAGCHSSFSGSPGHWRRWARQVDDVLREADAARTAGVGELGPELLADLRQRYGKAVGLGIRHQLPPGLAQGHGIRAIDAIHTAFAGNPWLPATVTT